MRLARMSTSKGHYKPRACLPLPPDGQIFLGVLRCLDLETVDEGSDLCGGSQWQGQVNSYFPGCSSGNSWQVDAADRETQDIPPSQQNCLECFRSGQVSEHVLLHLLGVPPHFSVLEESQPVPTGP